MDAKFLDCGPNLFLVPDWVVDGGVVDGFDGVDGLDGFDGVVDTQCIAYLRSDPRSDPTSNPRSRSDPPSDPRSRSIPPRSVPRSTPRFATHFTPRSVPGLVLYWFLPIPIMA